LTGGLGCQRTAPAQLEHVGGLVRLRPRLGEVAFQGKGGGRDARSALWRISRLCVKLIGIWTRYAVLSIWSKNGGSHARMVSVPPRFGVCPRAARGRSALPASVAAVTSEQTTTREAHSALTPSITLTLACVGTIRSPSFAARQTAREM